MALAHGRPASPNHTVKEVIGGREVADDNPVPVKVMSGGGPGGSDVVGVKDSADTRINPATEETLTALSETDFATESSALDILDEIESLAWDAGLTAELTRQINEGSRTLSKRFEWEDIGGEFKPKYIAKALPGTAESDPAWWVTRWTFADQGGGDYKPVSVESAIGIAWDDRVAELP